jgi:hypothetical protein
MKIEFDKHKCLELLKEIKSLKKEGKFLRDYDKAKNDELISYLSLLEDQIFWKSRKEYIQILESFCINKTDLDDFFLKFCGLRGSNLRSARMWKEKLEEEAFAVFPKSNEIDIQLNPKSYGFTEIISYLHFLVDICDPDVTLEMNLKHPELFGYGMSEEFLRSRIEEYFLPKIKEYCKES